MKKNVISIVLIVCATMHTNLQAVDGSLDTSFGTGGIVITDIAGGSDQAWSVLFQPDGKIVAVGEAGSDFGLARYNSDGSLDTSFGTDGIVTTDFAGGTDIARAVLLQPDGKIIAVGQAGTDFGLARYNPDGSLDTSFGTAGIVITNVGVFDQVNAILLQPDGKIVAVGQASADIALARYNSDGSLDTSFGTGGIVTTDVAGGTDVANAAILQPDGKIVVVGQTGDAAIDFVLVRYNSDGSLDSSFGTAGIVITNLGGSDDEIIAAILQPDGKIVAVGFSNAGGIYNFALARYNLDGSLDSSFGTGGIVTTSLTGTGDGAQAAILQSDGKIIAAGFAGAVSDDFGLVRYLVPSLEISQLAKDLRSKYFLLLNPNYSH